MEEPSAKLQCIDAPCFKIKGKPSIRDPATVKNNITARNTDKQKPFFSSRPWASFCSALRLQLLSSD